MHFQNKGALEGAFFRHCETTRTLVDSSTDHCVAVVVSPVAGRPTQPPGVRSQMNIYQVFVLRGPGSQLPQAATGSLVNNNHTLRPHLIS